MKTPHARLLLEAAGDDEIEVLASDPGKRNFGRARQPLSVSP